MDIPQKHVGKLYLAFGALLQAAMFLSTPAYYWWALISVAFAAALYFTLAKRGNKVLFLAAYVAVASGSFLFGKFYGDVSGGRTILVLSGIFVALFVGVLVMVSETDAA